MSTPVLDTPAKRLDFAIKASGLSASEVARRMGLTPGAISKWRMGHRRGPDSEESRKLGVILLVNPAWLMMLSEEIRMSAIEPFKRLSGTMPLPPADNSAEGTRTARERIEHARSLLRAGMADEQISIPKLLRVAAGTAVYTPAEDERSVSVGRKSIEALVGPVPTVRPETVVFAAEVKGDSMEPSLLNGDTLLVKRFVPRARGPLIESGRVYLLAPDNNGDAQVKRLLLVDGHQLLVVSDNQRFPPKAVDLRNAERVQHMIIGQAVRLIRNL